MWSEVWNPQTAFFSDGSREIINRSAVALPGNISNWAYYTPVQVVFQVLADNGLPLPNAKVEVFPALVRIKTTDNNLVVKNIIPNAVALTRVTDGTGRVFLGDQEHLFHNTSNLNGYSNGTALLKVTSGKDVRYAAITLSYLNTLYFDQGMTNFATISEPFSGLVKEADAKGKTIQSFNKLIEIPSENQDDRVNMARHVYEELKINGLINNQ